MMNKVPQFLCKSTERPDLETSFLGWKLQKCSDITVIRYWYWDIQSWMALVASRRSYDG